ncbi:sensor domain-containing diguanylate cyclase [Actinoplanes sp. TRM 88003]|uniref:Sensor domain-containing diguanylate cyclase n=1 Tax=Paractinoplanes aksuensis TaxID=2939490 RepID=A0ABT1E1F0_9ACTN|nr:diguanylate cyclase [Actinoplanes aksuensis]MCO8276947.1 sensor domain-containing diguanylate cyclase [Actinoplanes aksuensis]
MERRRAESAVMSRAKNLFVVGGLVVAAAWSLFERTWIDLAQAATVLVVLVVVLRMLAERDADLRALRRGVAREQVLSELGTALIHATDPAEVRRHAVSAAGTLLTECPGARATIVGLDDGRFTVAEASGADADALRGRTVPAAQAPAGLVDRLLAGEVVVVHNPAELGYTNVEAVVDRPYTLLPLTNGDRFFGVLSVSAEGELPAEIFQSLQALRTQVALALASVALTAELTERALRDPLTGLGNRALLRERLGEALARSRRSGRPVGALLLDLNGFKQVNDKYGHTVGDHLLQAVAGRLRECVRDEDTVGRLGGDEFVVITEDLASARDALAVAERIVDALDETITMGGRKLRTPASVGVALSHADVADADELLRMADTAMYEAKRRGGGGFQLHGSPASREHGAAAPREDGAQGPRGHRAADRQPLSSGV